MALFKLNTNLFCNFQF